jgi:hypothetical protein
LNSSAHCAPHPCRCLPLPTKREGQMRNHKQDNYDGGRAASLMEDPATEQKRPEKKLQDPDELALALALLALTEGGDL